LLSQASALPLPTQQLHLLPLPTISIKLTLSLLRFFLVDPIVPNAALNLELEPTARSWRSPYDTPVPGASGSRVPASMAERMVRAQRRNGVGTFSPVLEETSTNNRPASGEVGRRDQR
jgi:hypothetical protein